MNSSARISFAAVTAALIVVAFCFSACHKNVVVASEDDPDKWKFNLQIHGTSEEEAYLPVDTEKFDKGLCNLDKPDPTNPGHKKGYYKIKFKADPHASETPDYHPTCTPSSSVRIEKITKSAIADNGSGDASAANDPNATQRVRVQRAQDLEAVLAAFIEPSPTPTPGP